MTATQYFIVAAVILTANGAGYLSGALADSSPTTNVERTAAWIIQVAHRAVLVMGGILIAKGLLAL